MFLNNKYTKWYVNIIETANARTNETNTYLERHHIIPRSLGGDDNKENLVQLTGREHFIVHHLLTKMCESEKDTKTAKYALGAMMFDKDARQLTSRQFEIARINHGIAARGPCPSKARPGELNGMFGKTHTQEVKDSLSINATERFKGKTYEEIMGKEKAVITKEIRRVKRIDYLKAHPQTGALNPNADDVVYKFYNVHTDEVFSGTAIDFRNYTGVGKSCCVEVLRYGATRKKWKLLSSNTESLSSYQH